MPSQKQKRATMANAAAPKQATDAASKAEPESERPSLGKSSLRGNVPEMLAQGFTLYFFLVCYWNTLEKKATANGVRYSVDDPNAANLAMVAAMAIFWGVHRGLGAMSRAVLMPIIASAALVFGTVRHLRHQDLYSDPSAFVPWAWAGLAGLHFLGACIAFTSGVMASRAAQIKPSVTATVAIASIAAMLAVPVSSPSSRMHLLHPHPEPVSSRYITMDDGVRIAADVYLPATWGVNATAVGNFTNSTALNSVPVVIQFTRFGRAREVLYPFNKFQLFGNTNPRRAPGGGVHGAVPLLRQAGYGVLMVDMRGTGASFGRSGAPLHPRELRDVESVVEWTSQQTWCNGSIALLGAGIDGTTVALAASRGADVVAVATVDAPADPFTDLIAPGGIPCSTCGMPSSTMSAKPNVDINMLSETMFDWTSFLQANALGGVPPVAGWEHVAAAVQKDQQKSSDPAMQSHNADPMVCRDDVIAVGKSKNLSFATIDAADRAAAGLVANAIPILSTAGWTVGKSVSAAATLHTRPLAAGSRLVLGPWGGAGRTCLDSSSDACVKAGTTPADEVVRFLDCTIRGDCDEAARVLYYADAEWQTAASWPPSGIEEKVFYFAPGKLASNRPELATFHVPVDDATTTGHRSRWNTAVGVAGFSVAYPDVSSRGSKFETEILPSPLRVIGSPVVDIMITPTNGEDAAVFVYLQEISSDGQVTYVSEGQALASHPVTNRMFNVSVGHPEPFRRSFRRNHRKTVDGPTSVELVLEPIAHTFAAGSKIQLSLTGADADNFELSHSKQKLASSWEVDVRQSTCTLPLSRL